MNPPLRVKYADLKRAGENALRSECPYCVGGILLMHRHPDTLEILEMDRCISCGQAVLYTDLEKGSVLIQVGDHTELSPAFRPEHVQSLAGLIGCTLVPEADTKKETTYDREAGFPLPEVRVYHATL